MRRGLLRDTLDGDLSTITIWSYPFRLARMRGGTGHSVRCFTRTHNLDYRIIIAVPMTMRVI